MRPAALGLVLALCAGSAAAAPRAEATAGSVFDHPASAAQIEHDLKSVTATLREARSLRGGYVQKKTLREIPRPLVAEGRFLFAREFGIVWRTLTPFPADLVITPDAIIQRDGATATRLSAEQQPGVRAVASVFFAVFALDFRALEPLFELHSRRTRAGWELGLKPRPGTGDAVRRIVVSGRNHVQRVLLEDQAGDLTEIRLHDIAVSREGPSAAEQRLFTL